MLRWIIAFSLALATSAAALPAQAQAQVWVPAWTASPAPDRLDGTPEAPVQFANQTVRQDMRLASSARALRFRISNELGQAPLHIGSASAHLTGTATAARPVTFNGRGEVVVPVGAALLSDPVAITAPALADVSLTVYFPDATAPAIAATTNTSMMPITVPNRPTYGAPSMVVDSQFMRLDMRSVSRTITPSIAARMAPMVEADTAFRS